MSRSRNAPVVQMRRSFLVLAVLAAAGMSAATLAAARGDLDPTFGAGGKVTTDFGGNEMGWAVEVQRDGKAVVAGNRFDPGPSDAIVLARYTGNGSLDKSFDSDGRVATRIGDSFSGAFDVALQHDGKIVAAGSGFSPSGPQDFALARYDSAGALDPTFGHGGTLLTGFQPNSLDGALAVLVQPDGKIVAAGRTRTTPTYDFAVARYLPNGTLDSTFDGDGLVTTHVTDQHDLAISLALQRDGKIVAGGYTMHTVDSSLDLALARYNPDGSLDTTFDGDGVISGGAPDRQEFVGDIEILRDGKLVLAIGSGVMRLNASGSIDTSFVPTKRVNTRGVLVNAVEIQPDRRILAIGTMPTGPETSDFGVTRLMPSGLVDVSFGRRGTVVADFGPQDQADDGALEPNGKLVVSGMTTRTPGSGPFDFAIARFVAIRFCVVPNVRHRTLGAARSALRNARCEVGAVRRRYSAKVRKGRVISQRPRAGARIAELADVDLVVSRGRRR